MSSRALYRSRQVWHALRPRIDEAGLRQARELLSDDQARLFFAMEKRDQRHAIEVMTRVRSVCADEDVLLAALLHDCGKGPVPVWLRVLKVLSPGLLGRLAREGNGWRDAAYRLHAHATLGADLARRAGCDAATVRLIEGRPAADELWKQSLLEAADDAS